MSDTKEKRYAMTEKIYNTPNGDIHYWVGGRADGKANLVFLPGLTADHRLFDKQRTATMFWFGTHRDMPLLIPLR